MRIPENGHHFMIFLYIIFAFVLFFPVTTIKSLCQFIINFGESFTPANQVLDPLIEKKTVFVSAYFELNKSKHSKNEYLVWIKRLLPIINCRIIIYTSKSFYLAFFKNEINEITQSHQKLFNFNFTYQNAYEIPCIANLKSEFEKMHNKDLYKEIHNPDLYAIWNSKTYLINSATYIYPDADLFFWVDSGCVREPIMELQYDVLGNYYDKEKANGVQNLTHIRFPFTNFSQYILKTYVDPPLEMCLFMVYKYVFPKEFSGHFNKRVHAIQAGGFFGTKKGIRKFHKIYWDVQNDWLKKKFFSGIEQDLFNYIFVHYNDEINFYIFPAFNQSTKYNGWFSFLSAFSDRNPCKDSYKLMKPDTFLEK